MVLSHSKLKRKRKEEEAAQAGKVDEVTVHSDVKCKRKDEGAPQAAEGAEVMAPTKSKRKRKREEDGGEQALPLESLSLTGKAINVSAEEEKAKEKKKKKKVKCETQAEAKLETETEVVSLGPITETEILKVASPEKTKKSKKKKVEAKVEPKSETSEKTKKSKKKKVEAKVDPKLETYSNSTVDAKMEMRDELHRTAEETYDPRKVFVGGMPYQSSEDDILAFFSECGVISELDCMTFPDTGNFRGIAFITFQTEDGALKALEYDGADMYGRFLKVARCILKPRRSTKDPHRGEVQKTEGCTTAYIGNLSWDITEDAIKEFFKKSYSNSKIDAVRFSYDRDTGEFQGYGHIDFGDDESLEAAVSLNQNLLLGRPLKIAYSVPPKSGSQVRNGYSQDSNGINHEYGRNKGNESFKSGKKILTCYNCGEEGHKSFLCPNKTVS